MAVIERSPESRADYLNIWLYIAHDNPEAADRMLRSFDQKLELIARAPFLGRSRNDLRRSIRSFPVGRYLLFYRPIPEGIYLVRVLAGSQDHRRIFRKSR